jgi:plasmid stabilization system protein ParE
VSLPIIFHLAARAEFHQAHAWYEKQRSGLGEEFSERVHEQLSQIAASPESHQCVYKDIRRAVVRRFPYTILYRIKPNQVRVIAVFHGRRDPAIWQARI